MQTYNLVPSCFGIENYVTAIIDAAGTSTSAGLFGSKLPKVAVDSNVCQLLGTPPKEILWKVNIFIIMVT